MIYKTKEIIAFKSSDKKSLGRFLRYLKVKRHSYAGMNAARIYNEFFGDSYSLKRYYKKYYKREFDSCAEFLVNRWNISDGLAEKLSSENYHFTFCDYKNDRLSWFFSHDEKLVELFSDFVGGIYREN